MDPRVASFADAAGRYCRLVETSPQEAGGETEREFGRACLALLLELYRLALELPLLDPDPEDPALARIENHVWDARFRSIGQRLPADYYWDLEPFPLERDSFEHGTGQLADDLADIWRDLSPGVAALREGQSSVNRIVHQWRSMFYYHWGEHAANAIRVLHFACVCPRTNEL
jgi:hypothetical protein